MDYYKLNKWIICDAYFSMSSRKTSKSGYVRRAENNKIYYCYRLGRTKCIVPNMAMFLFDAYTGKAEFRLNVHVTKYVIISPGGLPKGISALNFNAMGASIAT